MTAEQQAFYNLAMRVANKLSRGFGVNPTHKVARDLRKAARAAAAADGKTIAEAALEAKP
jgi:hypothetical protein